MSPGKVDLLELQKQSLAANELTEDELTAFTAKNVLLDFYDQPVRSFYNGFVVLPKNGYSITAGTWICRLDSRREGKYYVIPVRQVDASLFLELRPELQQHLAETLWNADRPDLEPQLAERYRQEFEASFQTRLEAALQPLQEENAALRQSNSELSSQLKSAQDLASLQARAPPAPAAPADGMVPLEQAVHEATAVRRVKADVLESALFTGLHYFVHISLDRRHLLIDEHPFGTVTCFRHQLFLQGLGELWPFSGPAELQSAYDPAKKSVTVLCDLPDGA